MYKCLWKKRKEISCIQHTAVLCYMKGKSYCCYDLCFPTICNTRIISIRNKISWVKINKSLSNFFFLSCFSLFLSFSQFLHIMPHVAFSINKIISLFFIINNMNKFTWKIHTKIAVFIYDLPLNMMGHYTPLSTRGLVDIFRVCVCVCGFNSIHFWFL